MKKIYAIAGCTSRRIVPINISRIIEDETLDQSTRNLIRMRDTKAYLFPEYNPFSVEPVHVLSCFAHGSS